MKDFCEIWPGKISKAGYGIIPTETGAGPAHRILWELRFGKLKSHEHLHHWCENKRCINLQHLEVLSPGEHKKTHADMVRSRRSLLPGQISIGIQAKEKPSGPGISE